MTLRELIEYIQTKDLSLFSTVLQGYLKNSLGNLNQTCVFINNNQTHTISPLLAAVKRGCVQTTRLLLEQGIHPDAHYPQIDPILLIAIEQDASIEMIQLLLEYEAFIFAPNKNVPNALYLSASLETPKNTTIFALLLKQAREKQLYDPVLDTLIEAIVAPLSTPNSYSATQKKQLLSKIVALLDICIEYGYTHIHYLGFLSQEQRTLIHNAFTKKLALLPPPPIDTSHKDNEIDRHNTAIYAALLVKKTEMNLIIAAPLNILPSAIHDIITDYIWHKEPPPLIFTSFLLDIIPIPYSFPTSTSTTTTTAHGKAHCCAIS